MHKNKNTLKITQKSFAFKKTNPRIIFKERNGKKQQLSAPKITSQLPLLSPSEHNLLKQQPSQKPQESLFLDLNKKLQELDRRADQLIHKKLIKKMGFENKLSLKHKTQTQIEDELEDLLLEVKLLSQNSIDSKIGSEIENKRFHDRKIRLMQKLIAEQSIEAEGLKKDFFTISAHNQKKKYKSSRIDQNLSSPHNIPRTNSSSRSITNESTSKLMFQKPKIDDYEKYRHKQEKPALNKQPIPRSSYKSDYLIYNSFQPKVQCKYRDSIEMSKHLRNKNSTYSKHYGTMEAQKINYRQLDSYRNKYRNLELSFERKRNPEQQLIRKKRLMTQELYQSPKAFLPLQKQRIDKMETPKLAFMTQSRRQYPSVQELEHQIQSQVRNKDLSRLKYTYKKFAHA